MLATALFLLLTFSASQADSKCNKLLLEAGLTNRFNETIAHTVHSLTVQALQVFNPRATENNPIPTVNHNIFSEQPVLPYAPSEPLGNAFATDAMNAVDMILNRLGTAGDGLGPNWSPLERVVHYFHMWDIVNKIKSDAWNLVLKNPPKDDVCTCLMDVNNNGITNAVRWVADHYKSGTPITLLNRPIPKLTDAESWDVWRVRLLHYYEPSALMDAAKYLHCVTRRM